MKKRIISLLATAMIAATFITATDSFAQLPETPATELLGAVRKVVEIEVGDVVSG